MTKARRWLLGVKSITIQRNDLRRASIFQGDAKMQSESTNRSVMAAWGWVIILLVAAVINHLCGNYEIAMACTFFAGWAGALTKWIPLVDQASGQVDRLIVMVEEHQRQNERLLREMESKDA